MANVIGVPLLKGNSQELVAVRVDPVEGLSIVEGSACFYHKTPVQGVEPVVVGMTSAEKGAFAGFIFDIDKTVGTATLIERANKVALRLSEGSAVETGSYLKIDATTGFVDEAGTITINGVIVDMTAPAITRDGQRVNACTVKINSNLVIENSAPERKGGKK